VYLGGNKSERTAMPKLERWIIAAKRTKVLAEETANAIANLGAVIGDGWYDTHQHVCVNPHNKEQIEEILRVAGYTVSYPSEKKTPHPELHPQDIYGSSHDTSGAENVHWLVASRMLAVLDKDTLRAVLNAGGQTGGGWCEIHQHIGVDEGNREKIEEILRAANLTVTCSS
jgi:hypothetical protein